jgi:plastocyanin
VPGAASKAGRAFSPSPATVNIGDTVTWVNNDSAIHTVTSGTDNTPDSEFGLKDDGKPMLIFPGRTFEYAATQAATFHYFCWLHPTMIGTLQVSNSSSSSSSPLMSQISLSTDSSLLYGDDEVTIQGNVVGVNSTGQSLLLLRVLDPEGEEFLSDSVAIDDDGNFTYPLEISGPLGIPGQYHVTALYNGVRAETSFSYVSSKDSDWSTAKLDLQTSDIRYRISGGAPF